MRYVSENFRSIIDEIIRPPLQLHFEVGTEVFNTVIAGSYNTDLAFDETVAPVVFPNNCLNERYYAIVGDGKPVDDPYRICAPNNPTDFPESSVPYGVTAYTTVGNYALIGNVEPEYDLNFSPFPCPAILSFKGGLIPNEIKVEVYDLDYAGWVEETTILNPDLNEEVEFIPDEEYPADAYRRFWVKNTESSGRYQFNWIMLEKGKAQNPPVEPISFDNSYIASINIDTATDLTSQTLPDYSMTIECLDVDEVYTPDSLYWRNQFTEGAECYLKIGYEIGEQVEYLPFFYGKLTKIPTYSEGKITFDVAVIWKKFENNSWNTAFTSIPNSALNTGDECDSAAFVDLNFWHKLFDSAEIFYGADARDYLCNYYGEMSSDECRQLVANALGCFITAGVNTIDMSKAVDVQYKTPVDYLTRYEQVQNTLDVQSKVSQISISRNENTLSAEYADITYGSTVSFPALQTTTLTFKVPFFPTGKITVVSPTSYLEYSDISNEALGEDGYVYVDVDIMNNRSSAYSANPKLRFFKVDNNRFEETEAFSDNTSGETYINDNMLITNSLTASKAKQVAEFVNNISDQYEVDVVQNYLYEIGDVVRLETRTGVYKTCVITGLNFVMPGSSGHVTCRRIFAVEDTPEAVLHEIDVRIIFGSEVIKVNHNHTEDDSAFVLGYCTDMSAGKQYLYVLGAHDVDYDEESADTCKITVTDKNAHDWVLYVVMRLYSPTPPYYDIPYITLPNYDYTQINNGIAYGAIELIKATYSEQGMNAPVDYDCSYVIE